MISPAPALAARLPLILVSDFNNRLWVVSPPEARSTTEAASSTPRTPSSPSSTGHPLHHRIVHVDAAWWCCALWCVVSFIYDARVWCWCVLCVVLCIVWMVGVGSNSCYYEYRFICKCEGGKKRLIQFKWMQAADHKLCSSASSGERYSPSSRPLTNTASGCPFLLPRPGCDSAGVSTSLGG